MLWFKKSPPPAPPCEEESVALGRVLDTVAAVLREYGRTAFDVETRTGPALRDYCERWALHLLVGAPRPGAEPTREGTSLDRRDWQGARRFFTDKRAEEVAYVARSLAALKQSLWVALKALDSVVAEGDEGDESLRDEMSRLERVAKDGSVDEIRREVLAVVGQVAHLGRARARRRTEAVEDLRARVRELGEKLEVARAEGAIDPLTRLYNRRALDERCDQILAMQRLFGEPSSFLMVDIDHFKAVNDQHGHQAGDLVLREIADALARTFVSRSDFVARYGGEELAVLLWGTDLAHAKGYADRLLDVVREHVITFGEASIRVTISVGVAELARGEGRDAWVARADQALYEAKRKGRDRAVVAR